MKGENEGTIEVKIEGENERTIEVKIKGENEGAVEAKFEKENVTSIKVNFGGNEEKFEEKNVGKKRNSLLILSLIIFIILLPFILVTYYYKDTEMRQLNEDLVKRIEVKHKAVERLRKDSIRLESLLKEKELNIKLDVQGIPQSKGGVITVNNAQ